MEVQEEKIKRGNLDTMKNEMDIEGGGGGGENEMHNMNPLKKRF